jgi:hypothetical protein
METVSVTVRTRATFKVDRIKEASRAVRYREAFKEVRTRVTFRVDEVGLEVISRAVETTTEVDMVASSAASVEDDDKRLIKDWGIGER